MRPLLFTNRKEIEDFATKNFIDFREDSTNNEVVFQRNFLRHKILPLFQELNPSFKKNVLASVENLRETEQVYSGFIQDEINKVLKKNENELIIDIESLQKIQFSKVVLFEILAELNFNAAVIEGIFQSLSNDSGKQFFSKTHRVCKRQRVFICFTFKRK